jgi:hypothetical protein
LPGYSILHQKISHVSAIDLETDLSNVVLHSHYFVFKFGRRLEKVVDERTLPRFGPVRTRHGPNVEQTAMHGMLLYGLQLVRQLVQVLKFASL